MKTVVVGGGLSGLFTALRLTATGVDELIVVDKAGDPGGVAKTIRRDGFLFDPAVGAVNLPHRDLTPLLDRIEVDMSPADPAASVRQVYLDGHLYSLPASPRVLLSPVLSWPAKLRAGIEPFIGRRSSRDESLAGFCRRRFGREAGETIAWLMASGVFAGDPERLSAAAAFPALTMLEEQAGSVIRGALRRRRQHDPGAPRPRLHYPAEGVAGVARRSVEALGDRYRGDFEVEAVRREGESWVVSGTETIRAEAVVLAISPGDAAGLVDPGLRAHLGEARTARVEVVGLGGAGASTLPSGFGVLIGPSEGLMSRGMLYESSYAPGRAPEDSWLLKVIVGGAPFGDRLSGDLVDTARSEAETVLGRSLDPTFVAVVDYPGGIPQYDVGHVRWLERLDRLLAARPGLHVTGWGYRGVGAAQLASDAVRVSREVSYATS